MAFVPKMAIMVLVLSFTLPWLLAKFAAAAQRVIGQKGTLMLENKK